MTVTSSLSTKEVGVNGGDDGDLLVSRIASKISKGIEPVTTTELVALSNFAFGSTASSTSSFNLPYLDRHYVQQEHIECGNGQVVTIVRYIGMVQDVSPSSRCLLAFCWLIPC